MFKRLGHIMYSTWTGVDSVDAVAEFIQDFVDQSAFLKYFKSRWVPKIEMWLAAMKILPLASQETCGAFESYHARLKTRLFDELDIAACQRVDWLVHKLITEVHSCYWLDQYAGESGLLGNIREQYINSTSWHRAVQIPDSDVILNNEDLRFAKVVSQSDRTQTHVVWNPGSEFALCDCSWSMLGYLCKHVIKVNMVCCNRQVAQPSMSFHTYHHVLLSLWQNSPDDSIALDRASARVIHMQRDLQRVVELYNFSVVNSLLNSFSVKWIGKKRRTLKHKAITYQHYDSLGMGTVATSRNAVTVQAIEHRAISDQNPDSVGMGTVATSRNADTVHANEHRDVTDQHPDSLGTGTIATVRNAVTVRANGSATRRKKGWKLKLKEKSA